jgi:hypothetical protein
VCTPALGSAIATRGWLWAGGKASDLVSCLNHGTVSPTSTYQPLVVTLPPSPCQPSSSGTLEPRFGGFDAPPSWSPTKPLFHATHKIHSRGARGYCAYQGCLGGLNAATYCRSAARILGSLVTDPWVQNWAVEAVFHSHDSHASIAAFNHGAVGGNAQYSQDSGTRSIVYFLGVSDPGIITGTILGGESQSSIHHNILLSSAGLMRSCSMQPSRTRQN